MSANKHTIAVKGVNKKVKPQFAKYNSGSLLLSDDTWINVHKDVNIEMFEPSNAYVVDIETNDKGYRTIIKCYLDEIPKPQVTTNDSKMTKDEWKAKDRSQKLGGIGHDVDAVLRYMALKGVSRDQALEEYKAIFTELVKFRDEFQK